MTTKDVYYISIGERSNDPEQRVESQSIQKADGSGFEIQLFVDEGFHHSVQCSSLLLPVVMTESYNQRKLLLQEVEEHAKNLSYDEIKAIFKRGFGDKNPSTDLRDIEHFLMNNNPPLPYEQLDDSNEYELRRYTTVYGIFLIAIDGDGCTAIRFEGEVIAHCYASTSLVSAVEGFIL